MIHFQAIIESPDAYDVDFSRQSDGPNTFSSWKFIGQTIAKAPSSNNEDSCQGQIKESVNASRRANRDDSSLEGH